MPQFAQLSIPSKFVSYFVNLRAFQKNSTRILRSFMLHFVEDNHYYRTRFDSFEMRSTIGEELLDSSDVMNYFVLTFSKHFSSFFFLVFSPR